MWKRNGLSLVLLALTVVFIVGQAVAGHHVHNEELTQHGRARSIYGTTWRPATL